MRPIAFLMLLVSLAWAATAPAAEYDPLAVEPDVRVETRDLSVVDAARDRELPLRVYLPPAGESAQPVVLFSHGLGGTKNGSAYLGEHWARRGYIAVFLQHPGSDDSVWREAPLRQRMAAMREAASGRNLQLRVGDVKSVLDQLELWNGAEGHPLRGRIDLQRVGLSGHSFGAVTTQHVSGQSVPLVGSRATDSRIKAAIAFSPSSPRVGDPREAFRSVRVPWLLMTGTNDVSPIGGVDVASRLQVFPSLPESIDRYELLLHEAEHSAFTDHALPGDRVKRNPNHHRVVLATSTAFWDAHLRDDPSARAWLRGASLKALLEAEDRWQVGDKR